MPFTRRPKNAGMSKVMPSGDVMRTTAKRPSLRWLSSLLGFDAGIEVGLPRGDLPHTAAHTAGAARSEPAGPRATAVIALLATMSTDLRAQGCWVHVDGTEAQTRVAPDALRALLVPLIAGTLKRCASVALNVSRQDDGTVGVRLSAVRRLPGDARPTHCSDQPHRRQGDTEADAEACWQLAGSAALAVGGSLTLVRSPCGALAADLRLPAA